MRLIDAHINLTPDGGWFGTGIDASVETALRQMDEAAVDRAGIIPLVGREQRDFCLGLAQRRPDRFYTGFAIYRIADAEVEECRALIEAGAVRFLKLHPRMARLVPLDERLAPFYDLATATGTPVVFCSYMRGPSVPMHEVEPLVFDRLAHRYPQMTIILAHAGTYRALDALAVAQSHSNVFLDISHVLHYFRGSSLDQDFRFILDRLDRKTLYGSDFPEVSLVDYRETARRIADTLEGFDAEAFWGGTAARLFGV